MNVKQIARAVAFLFVAALAAWAVYLLIVGLPVVSVPEGQPGEPLLPGEIVYQPYLGASYSLAVLLLIGVGLLKDKWLPLAWVGIVLHLLFGGLLIWSMGILYVAIAGGLAVPLGILQWHISQQNRWLATAWVGTGLALLIGFLLVGTPVEPIFLVSGILLGIILAVLQWRVSIQPL